MAKTDNPLVSIIIPVYNVEKYIDECLQSVTHQTYKNLEIILVDDATPDGSGKICDSWAEKDKRIVVIHKKKNGGLFHARITGLEAMKGEYFTVVDSDDYIDIEFIDRLVKEARVTRVDIVVANSFRPVSASSKVGVVVVLPKLFTTSNVMSGFMKSLSEETWGWNVWSKLYRSSLYKSSRKSLLSIEGPINATEDLLFSTIFASNTRSVTYVEDYSGYFYRQNSLSITKSTNVSAYINSLESIVAALFAMYDFMDENGLKKNYPNYLGLFKSHLLSNFVWSMHNEHLRRVGELRKDYAKVQDQVNSLKQSNEMMTQLNYELQQELDNIKKSRIWKLRNVYRAFVRKR